MAGIFTYPKAAMERRHQDKGGVLGGEDVCWGGFWGGGGGVGGGRGGGGKGGKG